MIELNIELEHGFVVQIKPVADHGVSRNVISVIVRDKDKKVVCRGFCNRNDLKALGKGL